MTSYKVTYTDYNGNSRTEKHYFNLNKTEVTMLNARYGGSLQQTLARLSLTENPKEMMDILMDVFKTSYGCMDDDGVHFRKTAEIWEDFASTPAFDKLFMSIMSTDEDSAKFMRGIMPKPENGETNTEDAAGKIAALQSADVTVE